MHDFTRADRVLANKSGLPIPHSWLFTLGVLKTAGVLGYWSALASR